VNIAPSRVKWLHRGFSLIVVGLAAYWFATRIDVGEAWAHVRGADFRWFGVGFLVFFLSLPLRALRWRLLLQNAGHKVPLPVLMETIFRAWTVNCAVPGRAGDLYGAYAVNRAEGVDGSRALGTIFTARVLDLLVLVVMIGLMSLLGFREKFPGGAGTAVYAALGLGVVVLAGLLILRRSGALSARLLPARFAGAWERFRTAVFDSFGQLVSLVPLTIVLWLLEGARLWCVLTALDAPRPFAPIMFLALVAAVVTTLPVTPGGLGTVEVLYQQFLPYLGLSSGLAAGAAILDRVINYWFILLAGSIYFMVRGSGMSPTEAGDADERE
jgi:uncharacterized protein (TIRG00374 family)